MATKAERLPQRTCVGCRHRGDPVQFARVAATETSVAIGRLAPGRGAWVCSTECAQRCLTKRLFDRALRRALSADDVSALRTAFEAISHNMKDSSVAGHRAQRSAPTKG